MREREIRDVLPQADADFVRSLEGFDIPSHLLPQFQERLPRLHDLYLRKREAFVRGDADVWEGVLQEELAFISQAEHDV